MFFFRPSRANYWRELTRGCRWNSRHAGQQLLIWGDNFLLTTCSASPYSSFSIAIVKDHLPLITQALRGVNRIYAQQMIRIPKCFRGTRNSLWRLEDFTSKPHVDSTDLSDFLGYLSCVWVRRYADLVHRKFSEAILYPSR